MKIELMNTTQILLDEISNKEMYKKDIALTYGFAINSSDNTDWSRVNKAIIGRWSILALKDIKKWAYAGKL